MLFRSDSAEHIRRAAFECLSRVKLDRSIRLVGVRVGNLEKTRLQEKLA